MTPAPRSADWNSGSAQSTGAAAGEAAPVQGFVGWSGTRNLGHGHAGLEPLDVYIRQLRRIPLLSREEEVDLAKRIEAGLFAGERLAEAPPPDSRLIRELEWLVADGVSAKAKFIEANLRLVVSMAKGYAGRGVALDDLVQEGTLGLIRAVEKFDHTKGNKFSTYAVWWIRQAITRGLSSQSGTIRVPDYVIGNDAKVRKARRRLMDELGRRPTPAEIEHATGITAHLQAEMRRMLAPVLTLDGYVPVPDADGEIDPNGGGSGAFERLGDLVIESVSLYALNSPDRVPAVALESALECLSERERTVLRMRNSVPPRTLQDIGAQYGVTRERIRQIESTAMRKVRAAVHRLSETTPEGQRHGRP